MRSVIACAWFATACGGADEARPGADDAGVAHDAVVVDAAIPDATISDATIPDAMVPDAQPPDAHPDAQAVCWGGEPVDPGPPPGPWPEPDAGMPPDINCTSNDDCPADMYCRPSGSTGKVNDPCARFPWDKCVARPTSCADLEPDDLPSCGCDHAWYASGCHAAQAGVKPNADSCGAPPTGYHACGTLACRSGVEYCFVTTILEPWTRSTYACLPLEDDTTCASLEAETTGCFLSHCYEPGCREIQYWCYDDYEAATSDTSPPAGL